jgi:hypothetical protein
LNPADKALALPIPEDLRVKLSADQLTILVVLRENGSARSSELAQLLKKNPGRLNGLMTALRRLLHEHQVIMFTDENLPTGETLYRYKLPEKV